MFRIKKVALRKVIKSLSVKHRVRNREAAALVKYKEPESAQPKKTQPEENVPHEKSANDVPELGRRAEYGRASAGTAKASQVPLKAVPPSKREKRYENRYNDPDRKTALRSKKGANCFESLVIAVRRYRKKEMENRQREIPDEYWPPGSRIPAAAVAATPQALAFGMKMSEAETDSTLLLDTKKLARAEDIARNVHLEYALSPSNPKKGEAVFAWSNIKWNPPMGCVTYEVNEPELDETDRAQINRIKQIIEEKLDIPFDAVQTASAVTYLKKSLADIITQFGMQVSSAKRAIYEYYILRDFIGFGKIQPLMNDPNLEDVSCDGINIPIYVYHRNPLVGSVRTNIVFTSKDELDDFVMRLAQKCGKSISVSEPLSEGALPDGSRVQATLGTDIARRGSNFTIRKFTADPLTPMHLLSTGTLNEEMLAYFWYAIENNASVLIAGPTASGKTSLLNALSLFIKPSLKIVTIEDTPELKLPHSHWVPEVSRAGFGVASGKMVGEVSMFDLLKSSLRQRPDYIIVGEVRGEEAYVLFQQMASGHSGLSTIHADSIDKVLDRLTTPPINLPAILLETLDLIIFTKHIRYAGKYVRKVMDVREIKKYNTREKVIESISTFAWLPETDTFTAKEESSLLRKIATNMGLSVPALKVEIKNRIKIIKWMKLKRIINFRDVGRVIASYYSNPTELLDTVEMDL